MTWTVLLRQPVLMMTQAVFPIAVNAVVINHDIPFFWLFYNPQNVQKISTRFDSMLVIHINVYKFVYVNKIKKGADILL